MLQSYYVDDLGGSPAMANRKDGIIYFDKNIYPYLPDEHKLFIRLHEIGHISLQTRDENLADEFAFNHYVNMGNSLTESIYALSKILSFAKPGHYIRLLNQYKRALLYDFQNNNNTNALNILKKMTPEENNSYYEDVFEKGDIFDEAEIMADSSFLGLGKKARERRDIRFKARMERKAVKTDKKQAKADAIRMRAEAKAVKAEGEAEAKKMLAEQGIESQSAAEKFLQKAGEAVSNVAGGGAMPGPEDPEEKKILGMSTTTAIIVGVVVLLVILFLVYWFFLRKKK